MASLLEVLVTFLGAILVLALAAQSLQEIVKHSFALKGWTRLTAVRRLVVEASRAGGLMQTDGAELVAEIMKRLSNLGQPGVLPGRVRLDTLDKDQLKDLIQLSDPARVSGLRGLGEGEARDRLKAIAQHAERWFDLALEPVIERYRRRMRLSAIAASLVVVLSVNANAFEILDRARSDPAFRQRVAAASGALAHADSGVQALSDSLAAARRDTVDTAALDGIKARLDSATAHRDALGRSTVQAGGALFVGYEKDWQFRLEWFLGILLSTLLVSLGAPFWHDVLESVFGIKNILRRSSATDRGTANGASA